MLGPSGPTGTVFSKSDRPPEMRTSSARHAPFVALIVATCCGGSLAPAAESSSKSPYTEVDHINVGLPHVAGVDLGPPQAALENFILSCDRLDYTAASHSLNLNSIPADRQTEVGAVLARQLKEVMD